MLRTLAAVNGVVKPLRGFKPFAFLVRGTFCSLIKYSESKLNKIQGVARSAQA